MLLNYLIYLTTIAVASAATSYQYIRFSKPGDSNPSKLSRPITRSNSGRPSRSYHYQPLNFFEEDANFLHDGTFLPTLSDIDLNFPPTELAQHSQEVTDHYDPLLLTGRAAHLAARYIYGKGELFFSDYPHVKALLKNQEKRLKNGLAGHKLGSIRANSPFQRFPIALKHATYI